MLTSRQRRAAGLAISADRGLSACADQSTAPVPHLTAPALNVAPFSTDLVSPQWQEQIRALVRSNAISPLVAGRMYAAVSVAQYRAINAVDEHLSTEGTLIHQGFGAGGRSRFEAHRGAVSGASVEVLSFLFPAAAAALEEQVETDATSSKGKVHPSFTRGLAVGRGVGDEMIEHLRKRWFLAAVYRDHP